MKKILLATTALAMVSGVSGAMAQESQMMSAGGNEINIGGYYEFGYASLSDDGPDEDQTYGDSELFIDFQRTADNGLTYGVNIDMEIIQSNNHEESGGGPSNSEESVIFVRGGFGTLYFGHDDNAYGRFQNWGPTHEGTFSQDDNVFAPRFIPADSRTMATTDGLEAVAMAADPTGAGATAALAADTALKARQVRAFDGHRLAYSTAGQGAAYNDDAKVTYLSPNFNGFSFGVSWEDNRRGDSQDPSGEGNPYSVGARFSTGIGEGSTIGVVGGYYNNDGDGAAERVDTHYGINYSVGPFTATASYYEGEIGQNEERETYEIAVGWTVSDRLSIGASYADAENEWAAQEGEYISISGSYTIAPGLSTTLAYNDFDVETTLSGQVGGVAAADGTRTGSPVDVVNQSNDGTEIVWQLEFAF